VKVLVVIMVETDLEDVKVLLKAVILTCADQVVNQDVHSVFQDADVM
jgi:hypothetical protein